RTCIFCEFWLAYFVHFHIYFVQEQQIANGIEYPNSLCLSSFSCSMEPRCVFEFQVRLQGKAHLATKYIWSRTYVFGH
ncbi:unnamed protein product, partial [Prunus brigantina]